MYPAAAPPVDTPVHAPVAVPRELQSFDQWVGWDYRPTKGGLTKVPHRLPVPESGGAPDRLRSLVRAASTTDPSTWASYDLARRHPRIGFVFTVGDPFFGVDLDDCLEPDTGELSLVARVAVRYLASYAEVSPSGRGIKVVARGKVPEGTSRRQDRRLGVEMYDSERFFALTGEHLPGSPTEIADADLAPLYRWIFGPPDGETSFAVNTTPKFSTRGSRRTDAEIVEKALSAKNGRRFGRLWGGDVSGYPTRSEADLALCAMLVYWTDADPARVEALFSRSGLCREKWRERPDYRRRTIERAVATARR